MQAPDTKIAVTLYNLREHCKDKASLDNTLKRLTDMGYQAVQVSGVKVEPEDVAELLNKHKLFVCATHEGYQAVQENFDDVVEKLKLYNCNFTALGTIPAEVMTAEKLDEVCSVLNKVGKKFREQGIKLGYHNHAKEFFRVGKTTFLDALYDNTAKDCLFGELDVHWAQRGGGSPVKWIYKLKDRMPVIHIKDYSIIDNKPVFCEIGEGNLDWPGIFKACEETGVRWYSIEQDAPSPDRDIFASMELSYNNLKKMGVK